MTSDPPRLIGRKEAAAYCGIGESTFSLWVSTHKMPAAIAGTRKWDKKAIDARLDEISGIEPENKVEVLAYSFEKEQAARSARRAKQDHPRHHLDRKHERILVAMYQNAHLTTLDVIPGAGPVMMDWLVQKKLVNGFGVGKDATYSLTDEGNAEAKRIVEQWKRR